MTGGAAVIPGIPKVATGNVPVTTAASDSITAEACVILSEQEVIPVVSGGLTAIYGGIL
jgi:hypothetical protein